MGRGWRLGSPVEFDEAISYVTKIKARFERQPRTYERFLDVLHNYQRKASRSPTSTARCAGSSRATPTSSRTSTCSCRRGAGRARLAARSARRGVSDRECVHQYKAMDVCEPSSG